MPSDITGIGRAGGGPHHRPAGVPLRARAAVRQRHPGRRGEPHAAQDAGGAAAVDAGVPGRRRAGPPTTCRCRSWCSPPRTRSSRRAPTRCPRRSSTASCSRSTWATPRRRRRCASSARPPPPTAPPCARCCRPSASSSCRTLVLRVPVADHVLRYAVALCRATRPGRRHDAGRRAGRRPGLQRAGHGPQLRLLGRRAARLAVPGPGGQGAGGAARAATPPPSRTCGRWPLPVLVHRVVPNFHAEADGVTAAGHRRPRGRVGPAGLTADRRQSSGNRRIRPSRAPGAGPGRAGQPGQPVGAGAGDRRGRLRGHAPQPARRHLDGVHRAQGVRPRRRDPPHRLEGGRPGRPLLRQALRGRDRDAHLPGGRRLGLDGLRAAGGVAS